MTSKYPRLRVTDATTYILLKFLNYTNFMHIKQSKTSAQMEKQPILKGKTHKTTYMNT